jgi:hypothetical protein
VEVLPPVADVGEHVTFVLQLRVDRAAIVVGEERATRRTPRYAETMPRLATTSTTLDGLLALALAGAIAACGGGESGGSAPDAAPGTQDCAPATLLATLPTSIACHAAYRATPAGAFDERTLIVARGTPDQTASFAELELVARYVESPVGEGSFVQLVVKAPARSREVVSILMQLSGTAGSGRPGPALVNLFGGEPGGHGFTGLHYVASPTSDAQLQFWCTVP